MQPTSSNTNPTLSAMPHPSGPPGGPAISSIPQLSSAPATNIASAAILKPKSSDSKQKESDKKLLCQVKSTTISPLTTTTSQSGAACASMISTKVGIDESILEFVITDHDKTPNQIIKCLEPYYKNPNTQKWDASGAMLALERLSKLKPIELRPALDIARERFITNPDNPYELGFLEKANKASFKPVKPVGSAASTDSSRKESSEISDVFNCDVRIYDFKVFEKADNAGFKPLKPVGAAASTDSSRKESSEVFDWFNHDIPQSQLSEVAPPTSLATAPSSYNPSSATVTARKIEAAAGSSSVFESIEKQKGSVTISPLLISSLYQIKRPSVVAPLSTKAGEESLCKNALAITPYFNRYQIGGFEALTVTGVSKRPSDLFLEALFGGIVSEQPNSGKSLFGFVKPHKELIEKLYQHSAHTLIRFSANNAYGYAIAKGQRYNLDRGLGLKGYLSDLYGEATVEFSIAEIQAVLNSQKIYTSPELPVKFYVDLVSAMRRDCIQRDYHLEEHQHHFTLDGNDEQPYMLSQLKDMNIYPNTGGFLRDVETELQVDTRHKSVTKTAAPQNSYGFKFKDDYLFLLNSTLYQIGSMVVKSADNYLLVDGDMKLRPRKAGDNDLLKQIDLSGIRGFHSYSTNSNKQIMTSAFSSALLAAGTGYITLPAVGMGVWGGDPAVYWPALLDAIVLAGNNIKEIFINPSHQTASSVDPKLNLKNGEEFASLLFQYIEEQGKIGNVQGILNLAKITNLIDTNKDIYQLAYHLKKQFPNEQVSFVNASDPDVTLGGCTGMYALRCPHIPTTEENLAVITTGLLQHLNRSITYKNPSKVLQTQVVDGRLTCSSMAQLEAAAKDRGH